MRGAAPDLPTQPRVERACAHVSADRKGSAAAVREMERGKRRAPRGVGEVSPASKPTKIRAATPVFALCSYLTPSDPCICCKTGAYRASCLARAPFGCYGWWRGELVRARRASSGEVGGAQEHRTPCSRNQDLSRTSPNTSTRTLIHLAPALGRQPDSNHESGTPSAATPASSWRHPPQASSGSVTIS